MRTLTPEQQAKLETYPVLEMNQNEFDDLPEYSTSVPTQDSSGLGIKIWKHRTPHDAFDEDSIWFIGKIEGDTAKYYRPNILKQ